MDIKMRHRIIAVAIVAVLMLGAAMVMLSRAARTQYIYADNWVAPPAPIWADDTPDGVITRADNITNMQATYVKKGIYELVNGDGELDSLDWKRFDAMSICLVRGGPDTNTTVGYSRAENTIYLYAAAEDLTAEERIAVLSRMMMRALFTQKGDSVFSVGLADYLTAQVVDGLGTWVGYANTDCALTAGFLYGMYAADVKAIVDGSIKERIDADTRPGMGEKLAAATYVLYANRKFSEQEIAAARLARLEIMSYITQARVVAGPQYTEMIRMAMDMQLLQEAMMGYLTEAEAQYFAKIYGGDAELAIRFIPTPPEIPDNSTLTETPSPSWGFSTGKIPPGRGVFGG